MKSVLCGISALLVVLSITVPAFTAQLTSDFRDFENPFLLTYSIGQAPPNNLTVLGSVKITNSYPNIVFSGGVYITGTPSDPANVAGWGATSPWLPLMLNFDTPVKAFGITFDSAGNSAGSILAAYDGVSGTGKLIGQIESVPIPTPWSATNQPIDFVGIIDDEIRIRSVRLIAQGADAIQIRAMALSIPEPATALMCQMLLLTSILMQRNRYRR